MNYPKRGQMSDDGNYYTHTDGRVFKSSVDDCRDCDMADESVHDLCGPLCHNGWSRAEGAYVTTDEEQAACDMARAMIKKCCSIHVIAGGGCCNWCVSWFEKSCPARAYLAAHGQPDAWEVKT